MEIAGTSAFSWQHLLRDIESLAWYRHTLDGKISGHERMYKTGNSGIKYLKVSINKYLLQDYLPTVSTLPRSSAPQVWKFVPRSNAPSHRNFTQNTFLSGMFLPVFCDLHVKWNWILNRWFKKNIRWIRNLLFFNEPQLNNVKFRWDRLVGCLSSTSSYCSSSSKSRLEKTH